MGYIMLIYLEDKCITTSTNVTMMPRIGETIEISNHKFKVKDIIWHISEKCTWVELQVKQ